MLNVSMTMWTQLRCLIFALMIGLNPFWVNLACAQHASLHHPERPFEHWMINSKLEIIHILPTVFIIKDNEEPFPAYSMLVKLPKSNVLMVDAYTPEATRIVLNWVKKTFGRQHITAINTHYHIDRLGGNEVLIQNHIPIYGSDLTAFLLKKNGEAKRPTQIADPETQTEVKNIQLTPPNHLFPIQKGLILEIAGRKVEIYYPGPAHTQDNVVVYIPSLKLLFGGCMIRDVAAELGYTGDANLTTWLSSVEHLEKFKADWVIPGHPADWQHVSNFSPDLIEHTKELLKKLK